MGTSESNYIPTNVRGLDDVLMGGFNRAGFYLVQGDPGSGKTTLALGYAVGRTTAGEKTLYVSLTESLADLQSACDSHGWTLDGIDVCDLTRSEANLSSQSEQSVYHPAETELGEITQAIIAAVESSQPAHVIFDGLSELRLLAGDPLRYRRQLLALKSFFREKGITVLSLDDRTYQMSEIQPESLVGGNIILERYLPAYGQARRRMFVTKVRGSKFREGYHDYEISQGGLVIHPRLIAGEHHDTFLHDVYASGIKNLDTMLQGGLQAGTTTLLIGPAGVGKSTVSMQFAVSALKRGLKASVYVFDEVLGTMMERTEKLCLGLEGGVRAFTANGLLHAQQIDPAELSPGAFAHEVRRAVEAGSKIIIIDSLNGYLNAMAEERFLTTHLHELFAFLNQKGVVTMIVVAQHGMILGANATAGDIDVSYLADTVLLFRYFECEAEIRQALSIFKKRTGGHERSIRQLAISPTGIQVGDILRGFTGIMTGVPQYRGSAGIKTAGTDANIPAT